jgi:hypothetical protein
MSTPSGHLNSLRTKFLAREADLDEGETSVADIYHISPSSLPVPPLEQTGSSPRIQKTPVLRFTTADSDTYSTTSMPEDNIAVLELGDSTNVRVYDDEELALSSEILVNPLPAEVGARQQGLSSEQATKMLVDVGEAVLAQHRKNIPTNVAIRDYVTQPYTFVSFSGLSILIGFAIYGVLLSDPYQYRLTGVIVESLLFLLLLCWNGWLFVKEVTINATEVHGRAASLVAKLKDSGMNMLQEVKVPASPAISVVRVVRDGVVRTFPYSLLVRGDIIEMTYGDEAPCSVRYVYSGTNAQTPSTQFHLDKAEMFTPTLFGVPPTQDLARELALNNGRFQFEVLETPLKQQLEDAFRIQRPRTIIENQLDIIGNTLVFRICPFMLLTTLLVNCLRYSIPVIYNKFEREQWYEMILVTTFYVILPLLPLSLPSLMFLGENFGNAQVLALFDQLQATKQEYEDEEDVDEFDAAPPPTMDVDVQWRDVWKKFNNLLTKWDRNSLTRSDNLLQSLGSVTVICSVDKEGTLSLPFPQVEQLFCVDEEGEPIVLDVTEDPHAPTGVRFDDPEWSNHMSLLKPLGLNLVLNTNCGFGHGRKRTEPHRRLLNTHLYGHLRAARQTCECRLAREMGFVEEAARNFDLTQEIYTFAPYHASIKYITQLAHAFEVPSMYSGVFRAKSTNTHQVFSDGTLDLLLECCADYWSGSGLASLTDPIQRKILDYYQACMENDLQVVAYAYRPIPDHALLTAMTPGETIPVYLEVPCSTDAPLVPRRGRSPDPRASKESVRDETAPLLPIEEEARLTPDYLKPRPIPTKRHVNSVLDRNQMAKFESEKEFMAELVKGQTFLGMSVMSTHTPKPHVCDFIEDVQVGGIRFVYFSPAPERESKAYAERLGLETDWNSCILLSQDGDGTGYLELHDIKARLPRGIDKIRHHLTEVDDIPLHVSLFAECAPDSTQEMIRIFQEYGEVVCCMGSALHYDNTPLFAVADVSVAMEPLHTRAQTRNNKWSGTMPPLALAAALTTLPCALFMQADTSLYTLTQVIREARTILTGGRQAMFFIVGCHLAMSAMYFLSICLLLPPILQGYQMMWVLWIILPIVALSLLFVPHDPEIMTAMPCEFRVGMLI